ncbi:high mobility group protein 20A [Culicoides brevitarsis]|uniref:high mobility group protein 20A n=1 Tax=Culicoides brevitarsis TaxID=469753 RepID=UPI00307B2235
MVGETESPSKPSEEKKMSEAQIILTKCDEKVDAKATKTPNGDETAGVSEENPSKKVRKRTKRRKLNPDAPRYPLTGYVRYTNERRASIKEENPSKSHIEITKQLATEWLELPEEKKQAYMNEAEKDKMRYLEEMKEYSKTHNVELRRKKKKKKGNKDTAAENDGETKEKPAESTSVPQTAEKPLKEGDRDIQIFTEEFLEHNKEVESELKIVRKKLTDLQQQNSNLERYVESMKGGVEKLQIEQNALNTKNSALEKYLKELRTLLSTALQGIPLPDKKLLPTMENIDAYMHELSNLNGSPATLTKAKEAIRKLDFQSINT